MSRKVPPSKRYTRITSDFSAAGAPITGALLAAENDNLDHDLEVLLDPEIHETALAHRHTGKDSSHLVANPDAPNLIREGLITPHAGIGSGDSHSDWVTHDVEVQAGGLMFNAPNQWATHTLGDSNRPEISLTLFGAGCDLVVSCYFQATGVLTAGAMEIGLIQGGAGIKDDSKGFASNCRIIVPWQVIGTGWTRVWAVLYDVGPQFDDTSVRFCVQCAVAPSGGQILFNAVDVVPGRVLDYWAPAYNWDYYADWFSYGAASGPSLLETSALSVEQGGLAVELAPVLEN